MTRVRNDLFDPAATFDRGRPAWFEALWYLVKCAFFLSPLPWPQALKRALLRAFGARIGDGVIIKPRVNIHLPWRLEIGEHTWLGEEVLVLSLDPIRIGGHCCISQRAFLCAGNHDYRDPRMPFRHGPIEIGDGAWIGANVFVGPGAVVGPEAVAAAGSVVNRALPPAMICAGNPCVPLRPRWPDAAS